MAEAIYNEMSGCKAGSAGLEPTEVVDENISQLLREINVEVEDPKPRKLTDSMLEKADKIITFNCHDRIPERFRYKIENWDVGAKSINQFKEMYSLEYLRRVRDQIREKVKTLIEG